MFKGIFGRLLAVPRMVARVELSGFRFVQAQAGAAAGRFLESVPMINMFLEVAAPTPAPAATSTEDSSKVLVSNLSWSTSWQSLKDHFRQVLFFFFSTASYL